MTYSPIFAITILGAIFLSFALVIFFGLQFRKRKLAKSLELRAVDVWPQMQNAGFDFSGLLYGVWQDFSSTQLGMLVKDCQDQQVAKIRYRTAARGWIFIETPDGNFEADVSLRAVNDGSHSLCEFTRLSGGTYRFDAKSLGILESRPLRGLHLAPVFEYTLNGTPAGASRHIGEWVDYGRMLLLPPQLPLQIRLFVLALQARRS